MWGTLLQPLHGGAAPANANPIQKFIDSQFGIVFATAAHTFGAVIFTAGLAVYLYQARVVKHAKAEGVEPTLKYLPMAHVLTILGVGLNGLGGMMRLKESDHPTLKYLGSSVWVQAILIKHLFLVVGVGLALFLTWRTYKLAREEGAPANFLPETRRITWFTLVSFSTILLASVLGAVATNSPLPDLGAADEGTNGGSMNGMAMGEHTYYENSTGSIQATPLQAGRNTIGLNVETGATTIHVTVKWTSAQSTLDASLQDCKGNAVQANKATQSTQIDLRFDNPCAGSWTLVVTASNAPAGENYSVVSAVTVAATNSTAAK